MRMTSERNMTIPMDRKESAALMTKLVYPRIHNLHAARSVELLADTEKVADFLDTSCKIDALVQLNGHVSTVCSKIHIVGNGSKPYNTFTPNFGTGPQSTASQYAVLLSSIRNPGALYPYWTIEAYINADKDTLLSTAIVETKQLIDHVSKFIEVHNGTWRSKNSAMVWINDNVDFFSVRWDVLKAQGANLRSWFKPG
jgi:hypothetical protein